MVRSSEAQVRGPNSEIKFFEFEIKGPESGKSAWHSDNAAPSYGGSQHRFRNCGFGCPKFGRAHSPTSPHPATPNTPHRCTPTLIGGPVVRESGLVSYNPDSAAENSDFTAENSDCTAEYSDVMADTSYTHMYVGPGSPYPRDLGRSTNVRCYVGPGARTTGATRGQQIRTFMWGPGGTPGDQQICRFVWGPWAVRQEPREVPDGTCGSPEAEVPVIYRDTGRSSTEIRAGHLQRYLLFHLQRYGPVIYRDTVVFHLQRYGGFSSPEIRWVI